MTISIIKPAEGLRYVKVRDGDGYSMLVPIQEDAWRGVQKAEATARWQLLMRARGDV